MRAVKPRKGADAVGRGGAAEAAEAAAAVRVEAVVAEEVSAQRQCAGQQMLAKSTRLFTGCAHCCTWVKSRRWQWAW